LHARVVAVAFRIHDHAGAEFGVHHVLANAQSARRAAGAGRRAAEARVALGRARERAGGEMRHHRLALLGQARREPLEQARRNLVEEARGQVVARLAVQQPRLREGQVQALSRAREGHVHQAALLFRAVLLQQALLMREQALLQAADEHCVELQALGRMHGHQLQGVLAFPRLVLTRFQGGMGKESGERVGILA